MHNITQGFIQRGGLEFLLPPENLKMSLYSLILMHDAMAVPHKLLPPPHKQILYETLLIDVHILNCYNRASGCVTLQVRHRYMHRQNMLIKAKLKIISGSILYTTTCSLCSVKVSSAHHTHVASMWTIKVVNRIKEPVH